MTSIFDILSPEEIEEIVNTQYKNKQRTKLIRQKYMKKISDSLDNPLTPDYWAGYIFDEYWRKNADRDEAN